jgi:hypothetical protein
VSTGLTFQWTVCPREYHKPALLTVSLVSSPKTGHQEMQK